MAHDDRNPVDAFCIRLSNGSPRCAACRVRARIRSLRRSRSRGIWKGNGGGAELEVEYASVRLAAIGNSPSAMQATSPGAAIWVAGKCNRYPSRAIPLGPRRCYLPAKASEVIRYHPTCPGAAAPSSSMCGTDYIDARRRDLRADRRQPPVPGRQLGRPCHQDQGHDAGPGGRHDAFRLG